MTSISSQNIYKVFTKTLTATSLTIDASVYHFTSVSIFKSSGTVTVTGSLSIGSISSDAVSLPDGAGITINSSGFAPIDGLVINASAGECVIVAH